MAAAVQYASEPMEKAKSGYAFFVWVFERYFPKRLSCRINAQQQMIGIFTALAIFISCLGLLGLITYTVTQKAREIGIRKVIGASVPSNRNVVLQAIF